MAAWLTQGLTAVRDIIRTQLISHVGLSDDQTAHAAGQTRLDPTGTADNLIKAATATVVDAVTVDYLCNVQPATDGDQDVWTISVQSGAAATAALTRHVRTGVLQLRAPDNANLGLRVAVQDAS